MYQRVGATAFKKDLTNIRILLEHLGHPQETYPTIHLAGTNGKGTTAHLISALLQEQGMKVGLYTSPHYRDYRERIKINGQLIDEQLVIDFISTHRTLFEEVKPSFFEITVAMAFQAFAEEQVDIAVIETGLGGRLDSTNILKSPLLCVITNISYDHQQFLGDTLPEIAGEKAGIIKEGVPVIIGQRHPETTEVFLHKANEMDAPIQFVEDVLPIRIIQKRLSGTTFWIAGDHPGALETPLHGAFQRYNVATALQAFRLLTEQIEGVDWDWTTIQSAFKKLRSLTGYMGRLQVLQEEPVVLIDSAHNEAGWQATQAFIKEQTFNRLHLVLGMVKEKAPAKMLGYFPEEASYYFCKPDVPRGLDQVLLQQAAAEMNRVGETFSSVGSAFKAALESADINDLIFVGGSTFVVAEVV